ncbi:MAG: GGDEF domain-containing protein [Clostridia bacterium]|nr:GGDEF domain-containing protein [Clostridia bacterium]
MAIKYGKKKHIQNNIIYTLVAAFLIGAVFLVMMAYLYLTAKDEAYENLHLQTKQIKDDITLQLLSDRENLQTMASFASKLYRDGDDYSLLFESFKPIGLIENIGILNPDNTFVIKAGSIDLNGKISFEEEVKKGAYISGRVPDVTRDDYDIIRSAVQIKSDDEVAGILYGVIKLDRIGEKYAKMAQELDAQLFVFDRDRGDLVIDTVHNELGNISFLRDREYSDDYSYEAMISSEKGFTSFMSEYRDESVHMHYSTIDELGWRIALVRYDSQVFSVANRLAFVLCWVFFIMLAIIGIFIIVLSKKEKRLNAVTVCASEVRKNLLETTSDENYFSKALSLVCTLSKSRSATIFDTDGGSYGFVATKQVKNSLIASERDYFQKEISGYAREFHRISGFAVNVMCIKPNRHLKKTNTELYAFFRKNKIKNVCLSATFGDNDRAGILCAINANDIKSSLLLAEEISACFYIALNNKTHLDNTVIAATTDSLTGAYNRVAYKRDIAAGAKEVQNNFSCVYVDVNELHIRNNIYGHPAGDEMLICIANNLKQYFEGQKVYRMGGDEFLVFCRDMDRDAVKKAIEDFTASLAAHNYHVSVGMSFRTKNTNTEGMVREAEVRMYKAKALYYQNKEHPNADRIENEYVLAKTGIIEIDTLISVLRENYNGIYRVSLDTDRAKRILMPAYLNYNESEDHFSNLFAKYVSESVEPTYHRALLSFANYEAIRLQLSQGVIPRIRYKKHSGEIVVISIYNLCNGASEASDTLWVFAKE